MGLILTQALIICAVSWRVLKISWFSYILFLIFLGGLIVLFIYITSLASNEAIAINSSKTPIYFILILLLIAGASFSLNPQLKFNTITLEPLQIIYSVSSVTLISVSMIYLLLTLIIVVKITSKFEAPIKNYIFTN